MKRIDEVNYLKIGEVAKLIGKTPQTIRIWYRYKEEHPETPLPDVHILDERGSRYFKEEDIPILQKFNDSMVYGALSDFTPRLWGERGKHIKRKMNNKEKFEELLNQ